jgi:hypothetical protein
MVASAHVTFGQCIGWQLVKAEGDCRFGHGHGHSPVTTAAGALFAVLYGYSTAAVVVLRAVILL